MARGNSLVEYILPASLLGVLLLVTLPALNINLGNFLMSSMNGQTKSSTKTLIIKPFGRNPDRNNTFTLALSNGTELTFERFPENLAERIEVAGSSGATEDLLASLDSLIAELSRNNEATPEQISAFRELSNQGHRMALLENLLETHAKEYTGNSPLDVSNFEAKLITLDNEPVSISNILVRLGYFQLPPDSPDKAVAVSLASDPSITPYLDIFKNQDNKRTTEDSVGSELYQFIKNYQKLESSDGLKVPAIRTIVTELSKRVVRLSDATQDYLHLNPSNVNSGVISTLTNLDSKGICNSGQGQDEGLTCN